MRNKLHLWPMALGSVLGVAALAVAFSQPPSEPAAFNHAISGAGSLASLALLAATAGVLLRLRAENGGQGKNSARSRA